jgi:hypothetical protein
VRTGLCAAALLIALSGCGGSKKVVGCPLSPSTGSAGDAQVSARAVVMYTKALKEASPGTYKGSYDLVMQGQWTFHITVRSKAGDATTSALPVTVSPASK